MRTTRGRLPLLILLVVISLFAVACGGDAATTTTSDGVTTTSEGDDSGDGGSMEPLRVAIVAPSAKDDLAFSQTMVDSVNRLDRDIELSITDATPVPEDAGAAIRGYAEDGFDIVIAHGTQFGAALVEIAPDFPEVSFFWGTATDTQGLDNVFAYAPAADEGGYVLGVVGAALSDSGIIGVVGPVEAGDAVAYINGFEAGALASGASAVSITYTGSFGDVALAAEAAQSHIANGADVLTGTSQAVVGAVGVASENGIPWLGTQSNQTSLSPEVVVASQVYHWEVVLEEMLALYDQGVLGGEAYEINLANDGLVIEFNDDFDLPQEVRDAAEETIQGIIDGSIDPGF